MEVAVRVGGVGAKQKGKQKSVNQRQWKEGQTCKGTKESLESRVGSWRIHEAPTPTSPGDR